MAITPLPAPPSRADSANFAQRGDAFMSALPAFATQANALAADVNAKQVTASNAAVTAIDRASVATTKAAAAASSEGVATSKAADAMVSATTALSLKNAAAISEANAADSAAAAALSAASVDAGILRWMAQPIGVPIPFRDDLVGVEIPPTDNPNFRYIKLTAGDAYNAGVLTNETVTGSAPTIVARAVISLSGSPMNGQTIDLENTMRTFDRAGAPGVLEESQNASHTHTAVAGGAHTPTGSTAGAGAHNHTGTTAGGGSHTHPMAFTTAGTGSAALTPGASGPPNFAPGYIEATANHNHTFSTSSYAAHAHTVTINAVAAHNHTINASGGNEARPRSLGKTLYMRVK